MFSRMIRISFRKREVSLHVSKAEAHEETWVWNRNELVGIVKVESKITGEQPASANHTENQIHFSKSGPLFYFKEYSF